MRKKIFFAIIISTALIGGVMFLFSLKKENKCWQSELLTINDSGELIYHKDKNGFVLPNFSHAGYKGGDSPIPNVPIVKTIYPIQGDNTKFIQTLIDSIGALPKDSNGFRGALLLERGKYDIYGTIYIQYDGVVLRGIGHGQDTLKNTVLYAKGNIPKQRDVIILGSNSLVNGEEEKSSRYNIVSKKVAAADYSFDVENASELNIGDQIIIYHPCSLNWLKAIDYGGVPAPKKGETDERWTEGLLPISYNRYITNIVGNTITIDAPVFYTLDQTLSQSYIYKPNMKGTIYHIGLENICINIEYSGNDTDENHAWQAVRLKSVENAWVKNCTMLHFGQSGVITEATTRSTIENCSAINPKSIITGERRYNFNTFNHSQLILFKDCYANNGRHNYVSNGTSSSSGIVFLRCISDSSYAVTEGHRKWTSGMLFDNYKETNLRPIAGWRKWIYRSRFVIGLYNRDDMGTGHGWSAVQSVLWNCDADKKFGKIVVQKPPTSQNYAIGCIAKDINGKSYTSKLTVGYIEGQNKKNIFPYSLYEAQLYERLKK